MPKTKKERRAELDTLVEATIRSGSTRLGMIATRIPFVATAGLDNGGGHRHAVELSLQRLRKAGLAVASGGMWGLPGPRRPCPECAMPLVDVVSGCEACEVFECPSCKKWVPWEEGRADGLGLPRVEVTAEDARRLRAMVPYSATHAPVLLDIADRIERGLGGGR